MEIVNFIGDWKDVSVSIFRVASAVKFIQVRTLSDAALVKNMSCFEDFGEDLGMIRSEETRKNKVNRFPKNLLFETAEDQSKQ